MTSLGTDVGGEVLTIDSIIVGQRRREDYGDIDALADSIRRYGLFHPVVLDDDGNLIAGERRLRACKQLEWTHIDVRRLGTLSEQERREIELEENLRRKDLTPYEQAKVLSERASLAGEIAKQEELRLASKRNSVGHPSAPGSLRDKAERIGVSPATVLQAERHVETADAHPFMQSWPQYNVLEARTHLERLPEPERPKAAALVDQPGIPPREACQMLSTVAALPEPERERIYVLQASPDERDRSLAITEALQRPAMPDPRVIWLRVDVIERGRKFLRTYPSDPLNDQVQDLLNQADVLVQAIRGATQ